MNQSISPSSVIIFVWPSYRNVCYVLMYIWYLVISLELWMILMNQMVELWSG